MPILAESAGQAGDRYCLTVHRAILSWGSNQVWCRHLRIPFRERVLGGAVRRPEDVIWAPCEEILNLQPRGAKCKPYQVKQVRSVILRYKLAEDPNA